MNAVWTLAAKDLLLRLRDLGGLFWMLAFPLMFALFFGAIFGGGSHGLTPVRVAVVDEDQTDASRAFVTRLEKSPALNVVRSAKDGEAPAPMTRAEAHGAVLKGHLLAYVVVKQGFAKVAGFLGEQAAALEVGVDPSRQAEKEMIRGLLTEATFAGMGDAFGASAKVPAWKPTPIEIRDVTPEETGPRSAFEVTFPSAVLWGLMGCVTTFAIALVSERVGGTLLRLNVAPLTRGQVLAGKGLACFLSCAAVAVLLLVVGWLLLGVRLSDPVGLTLAIVCTAACFTGIMMLMSTLGKTEPAVAGAGWGIMMPLAMIGGGMVPLIAMPAWMQTASNFSPVKWGIWALEGSIWRGFSLADMLLPCAVLVGIGTVCFALGVKVLSRQEL
jgi:ABC-2 type transport system permease protein